jgi:DNA-binding MurR/RpiR family transcriptional regulator
MEANNRFLRVCAKTECIQDARMQFMRAAMMTENDVAILFSYSGATKETVAIAEAARDAGAHTISFPASTIPAGGNLRIALPVRRNEGALQAET